MREGLSNVLYWRYQLEGEGQADIYAFRMGVRHWSLVEALRLFDWLEGPGLVSIEQLRLPAFRDLPACSALRMFLDPERYACLRPVHLAIHRLPGRSVLHDVSGASDGWPVTLLNEACYERWCRVCRELARAMDGPARAGGASPWRAADVERALGVLIATGEGELVLRLLELGECLPPAA